MINIYNKTNKSVYDAKLRMWNYGNEQYDPDILHEIDTDLLEKWDSMIEMFVMDQGELDDWRDFWNDEIILAEQGVSGLLDKGEYFFICEKED